MRTVFGSFFMAIVIAVAMILVAVTAGAFPALGQEGEQEATAVGDQIIAAEGIDAPIVVQTTIDDAAPAEALTLERLELPAGTGGLPQASAAPLLLYVESGTLTVQDDFGFGALLTEGDDLAIRPGVTMTVSNEGPDPVSLLRIRLADDIAGASAATPAATPAVTAIAPTVLVQIPTGTLPEGADLLFLARATFSADASTGEQGHAGPIGIVVQAGSLTVLSPSGLEGFVQAGQGVGLPAETPLQATAGPEGATALIVGLVSATDGPFTVIGAPPRTTLQLGETHVADGADVTVDSGATSSQAFTLLFTYTNTSDAAARFTITTDSMRIYDDQGNDWEPAIATLRDMFDQEQTLDSGATAAERLSIYQPFRGDDYTANVFIRIEGLGTVERATWGFRYENGEFSPLPPDAVEPVARGPALNDRAARDAATARRVERRRGDRVRILSPGIRPIFHVRAGLVPAPRSPALRWPGGGRPQGPPVRGHRSAIHRRLARSHRPGTHASRA